MFHGLCTIPALNFQGRQGGSINNLHTCNQTGVSMKPPQRIAQTKRSLKCEIDISV